MSNTLYKVLENHIFLPGDRDLRPMTLTFKNDLDTINIHHCAQLDNPKSSGSKDINFYLVLFFCPMNYFLVTDRQTEGDT